MRYLLLLISLIIFFPPLAASQSKQSLLIMGGTSVPVKPDDFYNEYDKGFNIGAGIEFPYKKSLYIVGDASYSKFNAQEVSGKYSGSASAITVMVNLKVINEDTRIPLEFYIKAGTGFYSLSHSAVSAPYKKLFESKVGLALDVAGGLEFKISSKNKIFAEVVYNYLFGNGNVAYVPIKIGLKFSN